MNKLEKCIYMIFNRKTRYETSLFELDVLPLLDGTDDRHVSARPADSELLQFLYQAGLGITRCRLGEVLLGVGPVELQLFVRVRHLLFHPAQ